LQLETVVGAQAPLAASFFVCRQAHIKYGKAAKMLQIGILFIMGVTLYSRIKHPVLKNKDGTTKKRMHPALYWTLMAVGVLCIIMITSGSN
jgi:phosphatidylserine synthase